jgi:hypothetical protein
MENKLLNVLKQNKHLYSGGRLNSGFNFISHLNGELAFASERLCKKLGYMSYKEMNYKKFGDLLEKYSNYSKAIMLNNIQQLIEGAEIIDVVVKFKNSQQLILFTLMAIKLNDGTIVGVQTFGRDIKLLSHMEIILNHSASKPSPPDELPVDIDLNSREQMIISLLIAGFTQVEIGEYLQCSRGHVAKLIATEICPKFGIKGSSTKRLVKMAIYHNVLNNKIPEDLADRLGAFSLSL